MREIESASESERERERACERGRGREGLLLFGLMIMPVMLSAAAGNPGYHCRLVFY